MYDACRHAHFFWSYVGGKFSERIHSILVLGTTDDFVEKGSFEINCSQKKASRMQHHKKIFVMKHLLIIGALVCVTISSVANAYFTLPEDVIKASVCHRVTRHFRDTSYQLTCLPCKAGVISLLLSRKIFRLRTHPTKFIIAFLFSLVFRMYTISVN
jgi:hypothetical protein